MPASTSSATNMSFVLTSTTELASSYDIHSSSEEAAISQYQQCSDEAGIRNYKQLLEDIPEDGLDHSNISIWIQGADSQMLELFKKELVAMIDRSIQEINSKHGQEQESDMHCLLKLAGVMTMLPPSSDLLPAILRLYATLEIFPVNQVYGIASELKRCVREIFQGQCPLALNGI
ncbi:uncharacterized protein LOC127780074 [Oryza glaberrima]|uniref:uncharacterized protein LOC127780074 n=1 Tax=Oryza glaberrima TaxID=4538 RepID=UPI00224C2EE3|nr:uncharacterized protein LOC127780074 [Oryza glaberrima]